MRSWRRISFTRRGVAFTAGSFAVGFAAINTGNNLLYLMLGAMLGLMLLGGWLSERVIRGLEVERRVPHGVPAGRESRILYRVHNRNGRIPGYAVDIGDGKLPAGAFVAHLPPRTSLTAAAPVCFQERGVRTLEAVTLSTTFPFGFFARARDVPLPGELVVWPRTDRPLPPSVAGAGYGRRATRSPRASAGSRGEYRGLREYRAGDDPRDIHWRSSARRETPVIREYERDAARTLWICLDRGAEPGDEAEAVLETAASLAARAASEGRSFGLVVDELVLEPGSGPACLESVLDALARVEFDPDAPVPVPPVESESCVLVSLRGRGRQRFGDALVGTGPEGPGGPEVPAS